MTFDLDFRELPLWQRWKAVWRIMLGRPFRLSNCQVKQESLHG